MKYSRYKINNYHFEIQREYRRRGAFVSEKQNEEDFKKIKASKVDKGLLVAERKHKHSICPKGWGTYIRGANGEHHIYEGDYDPETGKKHGKGRQIQVCRPPVQDENSPFLTGLLIYTGKWSQNRPNGKGTIEFPNGDIYRGHVRDFILEDYDHGQLYIEKEKKLYIGCFENGYRVDHFTVRDCVNVIYDRNFEITFDLTDSNQFVV